MFESLLDLFLWIIVAVIYYVAPTPKGMSGLGFCLYMTPTMLIPLGCIYHAVNLVTQIRT